MFQENLPAFFQDFGSPVLFGTQSTIAIFDGPDELILADRGQSREYSIDYPTGDLQGLADGDAVKVAIGPGWQFNATQTAFVYQGTSSSPQSGNFVVLGKPMRLDDGQFTRARLRLAQMPSG